MISTDRLILRDWAESDSAPFAALNADADVMRYFPAPLAREASDAAAKRYQAHIKLHGFGLWAVELRKTGQFIGFIGLQYSPDYLPFASACEIGWRLDKSVWGQGLAPEGARSALAYAFATLKAEKVISITASINKPSMRVMEKIGMQRVHGGDFDHPKVDVGHSGRQHVLYQLRPHQIIVS